MPFSGPFHFGSHSLINKYFHILHDLQLDDLPLKWLLFLPKHMVFYFVLLCLVPSQLLQSLRSASYFYAVSQPISVWTMLLNISISKSVINHFIRVFFQITLKDPLADFLQPSAFPFISSPDCSLRNSSLLILQFIN